MNPSDERIGEALDNNGELSTHSDHCRCSGGNRCRSRRLNLCLDASVAGCNAAARVSVTVTTLFKDELLMRVIVIVFPLFHIPSLIKVFNAKTS